MPPYIRNTSVYITFFFFFSTIDSTRSTYWLLSKVLRTIFFYVTEQTHDCDLLYAHYVFKKHDDQGGDTTWHFECRTLEISNKIKSLQVRFSLITSFILNIFWRGPGTNSSPLKSIPERYRLYTKNVSIFHRCSIKIFWCLPFAVVDLMIFWMSINKIPQTFGHVTNTLPL